jgi:hypothetical protein
MNVIELLRENGNEIVAEAVNAIQRAHLQHYEFAAPEPVRQRLHRLFELTLECLESKSTEPMTRYIEIIASERFFTGFTLRELQTAFNLLEESIWNQILDKMQVDDFASAVTTVNAPLRVGKDEVARVYFSLVSKSRVSSLDLKTNF